MYTIPDAEEPIRQGDIFRWLPKMELVLGEESLPILADSEDKGLRVIDWFQYVETGGAATANIIVRPTCGIVISQDCDAARARNIAFCEIRVFSDVEKMANDSVKTKSMLNIIIDQSRKNQKWYYLAPDERLGFDKRMGVDFQTVFEVKLEMLRTYKDRLRLGRLNDKVAWPHFRERVAEYFRRYPYNEWYPLNREEVTVYESDKGKVDEYYPWQTE